MKGAFMSETLQLTVTGMTCGGCEQAVKRALQQIEGVQTVTASHSANQVGVTFDTAKVTPVLLKERIEALGYQVAPVR
jgi:copper chaperone